MRVRLYNVTGRAAVYGIGGEAAVYGVTGALAQFRSPGTFRTTGQPVFEGVGTGVFFRLTARFGALDLEGPGAFETGGWKGALLAVAFEADGAPEAQGAKVNATASVDFEGIGEAEFGAAKHAFAAVGFEGVGDPAASGAEGDAGFRATVGGDTRTTVGGDRRVVIPA